MKTKFLPIVTIESETVLINTGAIASVEQHEKGSKITMRTKRIGEEHNTFYIITNAFHLITDEIILER
jgi:hypothetical protein